ncbi:MAG TPA: hypothetical protein VFV72_12020 [Candidatus Limnocylindrales bacterium]|nr:hypothetical protein [Candidatus Limnocylindrales bacterium]
MAIQVERVGGVQIRMVGLLPTPAKGLTIGKLLAYAASALAGTLVGIHVTGPLVAGLLFGG